MTTNRRFRGGHRLRAAISNAIYTRRLELHAHPYPKCHEKRRQRGRHSKAKVILITSLVFIIIPGFILYRRVLIESRQAESNTEIQNENEIPIRVRRTTTYDKNTDTLESAKLAASAAFPEECNWSCYIENYQDLQHLDTEHLAVRHYLEHGMIEGRDCTCRHFPDHCSWRCYLNNYPDLQEHLDHTERAALGHWIDHGMIDQRDCSCPPKFREKTLNDTAAICAIVSSEEMYLDEWIDYHLGLGFSRIYIYDNSVDFDLGHGWLDRRHHLYNKVTVHHFPGTGQQLPAYRHCLKNYVIPQGHGWISFLDIDEFLVLKKHSNVIRFLMEYCKQGSVSINWQLFSWNERLQYSPEPVTKRFLGESRCVENMHVKVISNVDAIVPGQPENPHYVRLVEGHEQIDTDGNLVTDMWSNEARPTNVALIYHYHTKSHKEYIHKRSRGRSDLSGIELSSTVKKNVKEATRREHLLKPENIDTLAWDTLLSFNSKYKLFDSLDRHVRKYASNNSFSLAICSIVSSQEAYVDEWVDYHLALGFSNIYLFDSSEEFWMRQWGEERRQTAPVDVVHFRGNASDLFYAGNAYANCFDRYRQSNEAFMFMEVNDFLMPPHEFGLDTFSKLERSQGRVTCLHKIRRVLFGNGNQFVYDPLPVTKRFQLRVDEYKTPLMHPILLAGSGFFETTKDIGLLASDFLEYLTFGTWLPKYCSATSTEVFAHHYIRSKKECMQQRDDVELCSLTGDTRDTTAWEQMKRLVPSYIGYNDML